MSRKLTNKQKLFVEEYLVDLNATQAALRAGYSKKMAGRIGYQLLEKTRVQEAIQKAIEDRQKRTQITSDRVLNELARVGFSDIRGAFNEHGALKRPEDWDDATAAAISSIEVVTKNIGDGEVEYVHKIRLWDKKGSLELIGKHLKMFTDKVEIDSEPPALVVNVKSNKS
jgi:phage terminase small subunit